MDLGDANVIGIVIEEAVHLTDQSLRLFHIGGRQRSVDQVIQLGYGGGREGTLGVVQSIDDGYDMDGEGPIGRAPGEQMSGQGSGLALQPNGGTLDVNNFGLDAYCGPAGHTEGADGIRQSGHYTPLEAPSHDKIRTAQGETYSHTPRDGHDRL
jgi:hypothetical protein